MQSNRMINFWCDFKSRTLHYFLSCFSMAAIFIRNLPDIVAMITGAHAIINSKNAEKDRAFFRNVLGFPSVDAGSGWPIFALPASEVAVHPGEKNGMHQLYLTCDNIAVTVKHLKSMKVKCGSQREMDWGKLVMVTLPGGGELGIYEPKHPQPR